VSTDREGARKELDIGKPRFLAVLAEVERDIRS
jgi:hypothetical protein